MKGRSTLHVYEESGTLSELFAKSDLFYLMTLVTAKGNNIRNLLTCTESRMQQKWETANGHPMGFSQLCAAKYLILTNMCDVINFIELDDLCVIVCWSRDVTTSLTSRDVTTSLTSQHPDVTWCQTDCDITTNHVTGCDVMRCVIMLWL